jgi:hypothetical protein
MSGFRWNVEASAGPAREGMIDGTAKLLVRIRLFDEPEQTWPHTRPDAFCDLRADAARDLAFELLAAAEHADTLSRQGTDNRDWR